MGFHSRTNKLIYFLLDHSIHELYSLFFFVFFLMKEYVFKLTDLQFIKLICMQ